MYLTEIQDYFQELTESHTDIRHGYLGRTAFFRLQGMGALQNLPNNLWEVVVQMERFGGRAVGEYDANKLQQFITLRFGKFLPTPADGDFETAIGTCMGECLLIMFDFISKMKQDFNDDNCSWLKNVDFQGISWAEYDGPWIENHYGWDLNIPYRAAFPAYREEKWGTT